MHDYAGFVKLLRSDVTRQLLRNPHAYTLLSVIALRARFSKEPSIDGLTFGQARIGDHANYGMTRKADICARRCLERYGLATFKTVNGRGTIATLADSRVFALTDDRPRKGHVTVPGEGQLSLEGDPRNRDGSRAVTGDTLGAATGQLGASNQKVQKDQHQQNDLQFPPSPAAPEVEKIDSRHYEITRRWGENYVIAFDFAYSFAPRDAATLKRFLKTSSDSADSILATACSAWDRTKSDRFAKRCKDAATLHGLCTFYNDIRVELRSPMSGPADSSAPLDDRAIARLNAF